MKFYSRGGAWSWDHLTREKWLRMILNPPAGWRVQPPDWWLLTQEANGRSIKASNAIWYKNYPPERKYIIWDQAPEEDFIARGYLV